ncbi:MAG: substrate-binding domain-containing protein [Solirubrobacterales bacterium]|nr:substrate-binding domain-containing protein [Solirubrobacterales bacterium]
MNAVPRSLTTVTGVALAVVFGVLVAGCGVSPDQAPVDSGHTGTNARYQPPTKKGGNPDAKPTPREQGVIRIAGKAQGSLTDRMARTYGGAAEIRLSGGNEESAFRQFCSGEIDLVDSARPISPEEYDLCVANGIQPVQFQVASDAAVLAIKNETDVGADCLSIDEVYNIFRAGSSINSWAQVGYGHDLAPDIAAPRMKVAGPDENSNVFGFFGQYVLGESAPSLLSMRSDYMAFPTDGGVRRAVVGSTADFRAAQRYEPSRKVYEEVSSSLAENRQAVRDARAEVRKGVRDQRTPAAQARDRRLLRRAERNLENLLESLPDSRGYMLRNREALRRLERLRGTMGLFRFSYYEAFEDQLRPMEISASNNFNKPECIFPSQQTVTDATYPLSRQLLLTVNYRNMRDPDINDFLRSSLARSQKLAENAALVPLPDEVRAKEDTWLDGSSEPDVVFYGTKGTSATEGG